MEIVAMILAVVVIFQLIFVCKHKTKKNVKSPSKPKSKTKPSPKTKSKSISPAKDLESPAKTALLIDDKGDLQKTPVALEETQQPKQSLDDTVGKKASEDGAIKKSSEGGNKKKLKKTKSEDEDVMKKKTSKTSEDGGKKPKRKNVIPTHPTQEVSPPKQVKGKPRTARAKQAKTKRTVEGPTQEMEAGTQPQKSDVNVAAALKKSTKSKKQVLSNPIVTPVTDEFPTEGENDSKKYKTDKVEMKTAPERRIVRKDGQLVADYKSKKKKRGKDRNMSDPIVTPCTDEFPTDEEKVGLKEKGNANKAAA